MLMMLAFLIDQVQQLSCKVYQKARKHISIWFGIRLLHHNDTQQKYHH